MTLTALVYQNAIHYKEKKCFHKKNYKCGICSLAFVIN